MLSCESSETESRAMTARGKKKKRDAAAILLLEESVNIYPWDIFHMSIWETARKHMRK